MLTRSDQNIVELYKKIDDSIKYAALIQATLLGDAELLEKYFLQSYAIFQPKDRVGGDIYLFDALSKDELLLSVIDCTGHGVSGAFVTLLVKSIQRNLLDRLSGEVYPHELLGQFHSEFSSILQQERTFLDVGFDGTLLYFDRSRSLVRFALAKGILLFQRGGELVEYKGDRKSIGYANSDANFKYTLHELSVQKGDRFFLSTDGLFDQLGGAKDLPLGKRAIKEILLEYKDEALNDIVELVLDALGVHQGSNERSDDVTFVTFEV